MVGYSSALKYLLFSSDLNTAATWVFAQNPDEVPEQIREQVRLLQSSIENNFVSTIYFWYVHNLNEQNNPQIKEELTAMQTSARALLKTLFPKNEVEIFAVEVGNETIEKWYNAASKQIAVTDTLDVETPKVGFELTGDKWRAYALRAKSSARYLTNGSAIMICPERSFSRPISFRVI